jgi:uncharacterized low-complexity protein
MSNTKKPVALAMTATLAGGMLLAGSSFASTHLAQGYLLGADAAAKAVEGNCGGAKPTEGKCGEGKCGDKKAAEGKCGEGKCGFDKLDTNKDGKISKAEYDAAHKDGGHFAKHDTNKDGFISAAEFKAAHEGKCGEGKCGAKAGEGKCGGDKKAAEGKCGEGKCGGSI